VRTRERALPSRSCPIKFLILINLFSSSRHSVVGNFPWKRRNHAIINYRPRSFLYRLTSVFASVTTCDHWNSSTCFPWGCLLAFHLLLFTQPFYFYLYLPQQPAVCLSTPQSSGLDYHLCEELRWEIPRQADDLLSLLTSFTSSSRRISWLSPR
jgi:hypothetical protein